MGYITGEHEKRILAKIGELMKQNPGYGYELTTAKKIVNGVETDVECIRVYVPKKIKDVPAEQKIEAEIDGIPTDVVEIGSPKALGLGAQSVRTIKQRPFPMGTSGGARSVTAGTNGALWKRNGVLGVLSNYHVYKNGEECLQPGPVDGGKYPDDVFGTSIGIPIPVSGGTVDCSFVPVDPKLVRTEIMGIGLPTGVNRVPAVGSRVRKSGRTSELTEGVIRGVSMVTSIQYSDGVKTLSDLVLISPCSAGGDSGSHFVEDDGRISILLFAGEDNVSTIACKIGNVIDALGLELVTVEVGMAKFLGSSITLQFTITPFRLPELTPKVTLLDSATDKISYNSGSMMKITGRLFDFETKAGIPDKVVQARSSGFLTNPWQATTDKDGNFVISMIVLHEVQQEESNNLQIEFAGDP